LGRRHRRQQQQNSSSLTSRRRSHGPQPREGSPHMADLTDFIMNLESLPTLPSTSSRLVAMLGDREVDLNEVSDIVRIDESLSLTVLKYANSAAYGSPGREFNLRESIVRLGNDMLLKIVLQQQVRGVVS